jgi:hypothetical protein
LDLLEEELFEVMAGVPAEFGVAIFNPQSYLPSTFKFVA